ncbi:hypothetical protein [Pararhizobium sp. O133]|uniref:hypothetical protein n=1 Tax=Pararhizobium sp. O133 TaxID=3449278 RepID=UPI003F685DA0
MPEPTGWRSDAPAQTANKVLSGILEGRLKHPAATTTSLIPVPPQESSQIKSLS